MSAESSDSSSDSDESTGIAGASTTDSNNHEWRRQRQALSTVTGMLYNGDRDIYEVLGYDRQINPAQYRSRYERQDIAQTIVDIPAQTAWRTRPLVTDQPEAETTTNDERMVSDASEFDREVARLFEDLRLLHYLERLDRVAGIGRFGVMMLGLTDDKPLDQDPEGGFNSSNPSDSIAYLACFGESRVSVDIEDDPRSNRYGLPKEYSITFDEGTGSQEDVHWKRVIHVAENVLDNEVYGRSRMKGVWNRLVDLEKVVGSSAEMYWRGADRKFVANSQGEQIVNKEKMQNEIENLIHDLQSVAYLRNVELDTISGEAVDPSGIVDTLITLIAGKTGIPKRILTGSERGELASTQDRATFYGRMGERQEQFCEPQILRPLLDRLIMLGILSPPQETADTVPLSPGAGGYRAPEGGRYRIEWPTLFELNEVEQAEVTATIAGAVKDTAPMGDPAQLATIEELRSNVLGWSEERGSDADSVSEAVPETPEETDADREAFEEINEAGEAAMQVLADGGTED